MPRYGRSLCTIFFSQNNRVRTEMEILSITRVSAPHLFNADPDPAFHFNAEPDPDPAPHQYDPNLPQFSHRPSRLQASILSLHASF